MTDTARQAWRQWWDEEGSAMRPLPNEDTEQFVRRMTEIAWSNGAFKRLADVEYLCLKRVGLERELARLRAEVAALKAEREARAAKADPLAEMWRELAEYQPFADRDRELRERLVCAALAGVCIQEWSSNEAMADFAVSAADATLAAMRKGEQHAK